jgi:glucose/arabinose dehydrogenase
MKHMFQRNRRLALASASVALFTPAFGAEDVVDTEKAQIRVETVADGLEHPWAIAFLPDGSALVTEKPGRLRHVGPDGTVSEPIAGVPDVDARGQGGLLDVTLDPAFAENRRVYLSFAEPGEGGTNSTAVARGTLSEDNSTLSEVEVIFSQQPKLPSTMHYGSRLVFDRAGDLFVTLGERSDEEFRGQAQELNSHLGKIVRIHPDGDVPEDNPFVHTEGALPEIWSYGHRNIQAAALHPETGEVWEIEHGPKGGDELNVAEAGKNYGWPIVSFGVNYSGTPVGGGEADAPGFEDPLYQWTPVIAPSGMIFYGGEAFPEWQGNLFVGGLASTALVRLELDGRNVTHEERILDDAGKRIRDVAEGPGGAIYLVTDEDNGEILRLSPAESEAAATE